MRQALEFNVVEFFLRLGRAGGGQVRRDAFVDWSIGGSPLAFQNVVIPKGIVADTDIAASMSLFRSFGVGGNWRITDDDTLCQRLVDHGFVEGPPMDGMAVAVSKLAPASSSAEISEVRSSADLDLFVSLIEGFGLSAHEAAWFGAMFDLLGYGPARPWRHYLARIDGVPVATTTALMTGDVCGIYFVFTAPHARGKGVGAAITRYALVDSGCRTGILGATSMGAPVYRRLGFETICTTRLLEFGP